MSIHEGVDWLERLNKAFDAAEVGTPKNGDLAIARAGDREYIEVFAATHDFVSDQGGAIRILERVKPAWHDAVAILARAGDLGGRIVLIPTAAPNIWASAATGSQYAAYELRDVTPLIPAEEGEA